MGQSVFLAQMLGPILVIVGLSLIFNEKFFKKMIKEMGSSNIFLYMGGIISMFFGLYILLTVRNDGYLFQSILLVFGFLATAKGILLILFPKYMKKTTKDMSGIISLLKYFGIIYAVLGGYLCYTGYAV